MIIWIRVETLAKYDAGSGDFALKRRFEELSGEPCLVLHFSQATPEVVRPLRPRALLFSGCGTWFRDFDVREFYVFEDLVNACADVTSLAFCGSHQLLGFMFNHGFRNLERVIDEPMRPLREGEPQIGAVNADKDEAPRPPALRHAVPSRGLAGGVPARPPDPAQLLPARRHPP